MPGGDGEGVALAGLDLVGLEESAADRRFAINTINDASNTAPANITARAAITHGRGDLRG